MSWKIRDDDVIFDGYEQTDQKLIIRKPGVGNQRYRVVTFDNEGESPYVYWWDLGQLRSLAEDILGFCGTEEEAEPIRLTGFPWPVTIVPGKEITIGCHTASVDKWAEYTDRDIMGLAESGRARQAVKFWRDNRFIILAKAGWAIGEKKKEKEVEYKIIWKEQIEVFTQALLDAVREVKGKK